MRVRVNLVSERQGALKGFLDCFFEKDTQVDNDIIEWMYTYKKPLEAIELMSTAIDNIHKYDLAPWVSIDTEYFVKVTDKNLNMLIKYILLKHQYESPAGSKSCANNL